MLNKNDNFSNIDLKQICKELFCDLHIQHFIHEDKEMWLSKYM